MDRTDTIVITTALQDLFLALSAWEPNGRSLLLDISVHCPSDSEHWFKYLTFGPDVPCGGECSRGRYTEWSTLLSQLITASLTTTSTVGLLAVKIPHHPILLSI